ncbi:Sorcin protein [Spatholobus suberectus]|nr:Sorcin protein [Spatholobus suberectus]
MENRVILQEWFDRVDSEKSGSITALQLKTALAVGNLEFPLSVVEQMIRNGTMSFEGYENITDDSLRNSAYTTRFFLATHFDEFYVCFQALVKIGFMLDSPAFYSVCESFDQSKNGRFRLDNFISICIFLQSARNLFNSFDTAKQGRVTLDLNQFVYCSYQ